MEDLVVLGVGGISLADANKPQGSVQPKLEGFSISYLVISCLQTLVPLASLCVHVQSRHDVHVDQLQLKKESVKSARMEPSIEALGVRTESTLPWFFRYSLYLWST